MANAERSFLSLDALQVRAAEINDLGFAIERQPIPDDVEALPGAGVKWVELAGVKAGTRTLGRFTFDFCAWNEEVA